MLRWGLHKPLRLSSRTRSTQNVSIFVGNLPFRAEQEDVIELFAQFGEVANCALPLERDTGRKRGFAFVEMADEASIAVVCCGNSAWRNGRTCTLPSKPICMMHSPPVRWCQPVAVKVEQDSIAFKSRSSSGKNA